jgi:DNA-binding LytR/AlgR family response regulator
VEIPAFNFIFPTAGIGSERFIFGWDKIIRRWDKNKAFRLLFFNIPLKIASLLENYKHTKSKSMVENLEERITVNILAEGEAFATVYEVMASRQEFVTNLKTLFKCNEIIYKEKPLLVPDKYGFRHIKGDDIVYLEAERCYCNIHFINGKKLLVSEPMARIRECFDGKGFLRIHRSYTVNLNMFDFFIGNRITMNNGVELPVGREYKKDLLICFNFIGTKKKNGG